MSKLKNTVKKVAYLKETILILVVVVAAVVYAAVSSFKATGFFINGGYIVSGNALKTNLTSGGDEAQDLTKVEGSDTIFTRWGSLYAGEEKKTKINTEYPMYVSDGAGLRFFNGGSVLINDEFGGRETYDGLTVSGGTSFNLDGSQADPDNFILVKLSNGFYMNAQDLEVETVTNKYTVPANSVLLIRVDGLDSYVYHSGVLVRGPKITDLDLASTIRIGGLEMSYRDFLIRLQIYEEPKEELKEETETSASQQATGEGEPETGGNSGGGEDETGKAEGDKPEADKPGETGEGEGVYGEGVAEAEAGAGEESASGSSGGNSSKGRGSKGSGSVTPPAAAAADPADRPSEVPPAEEPQSVPQTEPETPQKGKKTPTEHPKIPPGAKENPNWKDPSVVAGSVFIPGVYTLKTSVIINDPAGVIVNGITYEIVIMDDYGKMTLYKRVYVRQEEEGAEQTVLISGLKPDSRYSITGTYRYEDKYGRTVTESRTFLPTKDFSTKSVKELGPIKVADLELQTAEIYYNRISIPHIQFTEDSDQDAIGSLAKASVRLNEGKADAYGDPFSSAATEKLKSYQSIVYSSAQVLKPAQEYTINFLCYDQFYNQLRVEDADGNTQWKTRTCYELPKASLIITNQAASGTVDIKVRVANPADLDYSDLKLRVMTVGSYGEPSTYVKLDGENTWLPLEKKEEQTVTIQSPGSNASFVASVWCICDNGDGTYQKEGKYERSIGTKKFSTADISELGDLYLDVHNITASAIEEEIRALGDDEKKIDAKKREISTRAVITVQINKDLTNPALYTSFVDMVTFKLSSGAEKYQVTFDEEELATLLSGGILTLDTNDTTRFPYISGGLTSNTTYSVSFAAECWFDEEGKNTVPIRVSSNLSTVRTALRSPEVFINGESFGVAEGFIYMDVRVVDLDNVISGEEFVLKITEAETGTSVGSFRIAKNKDDWYELRLTKDKSKSTGGISYNIKANTEYITSFVAEEAHTDDGYETNYVFYRRTDKTNVSLSGKIYSMGLQENDPADGNYTAEVGYTLTVPKGYGTKSGYVYVDEYRNKLNAATGETEKTKLGTRKIAFDESGIQSEVSYHSVEYLTDYSYSSAELEEAVKDGTAGQYDIPEEYQVCEYVESRGSTYIDTKYHPNQDTRVVADVYLKGWNGSYGAVFGINDGNAAGKSYGLYFGSKSYSNYNSNKDLGWGNIFGKRWLFDKDANVLSRDGIVVLTDTYQTFEPSKNESLFINAVNWGGSANYFCKQKIYGFRIYDGKDDLLVRDFIPCYETETATYGLYDVVNGEFYKGIGNNGSFTGQIDDCRYYCIRDGKKYRLGRTYAANSFTSQVEKDSATTNSYSYEFYFLFQEGTAYEEKVPLSSISFTTEAEINTIATGDEFISKGGKKGKYVVIDDIEYDNRDVKDAPLGTFQANVDFQGFSFETFVNYGPIVSTSTKTSSISNMVLKATAGRLSVAGTNSWEFSSDYRGGCLFSYWYGKATNLYIEFSQEDFPYVYNKGTYFAYWSTKSPEEMQKMKEEADKNSGDPTNAYKFRIQPVVSSFCCDNYGKIEDFVVDLQTEICGTDYIGGLCAGNMVGAEIRNGYTFSSVGAVLGDYSGKLSTWYGRAACRGWTNDNGCGGICSYTDSNGLLENCYSIVNVNTYVNSSVSRNAGTVVGMTHGGAAKVYNCYGIGSVLYHYTDSEGADAVKVRETSYGPAIGKKYNGSKVENIFYLSDYVYANTPNILASIYALKNKDWQHHILNSNNGFVVDEMVGVGFYPQVNFTSAVMPTQLSIPLPGLTQVQTKTDVAYAYDCDDPEISEKIRKIIESENYGNEAWDSTTGSAYYDSNDQVLCILIAEADQTRIVYSLEVENFPLTHEDILYQKKDGSGIISVYVRMHNPRICQSRYRVLSVTYEKLEGAGAGGAGETVILNGSRYAEAEYYKRIWNEEKTEADSWEAMAEKYGTSVFPENMVLKADLDFSGMSADRILIRGTYTGKLKGTNPGTDPGAEDYAIRNITYDPGLAGTFGLTSTDSGFGLINSLEGSVSDLVLENIQLEGGQDAGIVCAKLSGGTIDHVFVRNSYLAGGRLVGGLTGLMDGGYIYNSGVTDTKILHDSGARQSGTDANGYGYYTGGVAGMILGAKIQNTYAQNVYIESMYQEYSSSTGGLVGYQNNAYCYVDACYATGTIHSNSDFTGGLFGAARGKFMSFTNCYTDVDIYSYNYRADPLIAAYAETGYPDSVISFGSVIQAIDFERGSGDERTSAFTAYPFTTSYKKSVKSYEGYRNRQIFNYLSARYYTESESDYNDGELPKLLDSEGVLLPGQHTEYVGQDYAAELTDDSGIAVDSSSIQVTQTAAGTYQVKLTVHHSKNVMVTGLSFGFDYVDELCNMDGAGNSRRLLSFTDTPVFTGTENLNIYRKDAYTSELTFPGVSADAAYDRYYVTAVKYVDPQKPAETRYQRVGLPMSAVTQQWKTVSSASEWTEKIFGTHCENFKITGNIDFSATDFYPNDNSSSNVVNRLIGMKGQNEPYDAYKGTGGAGGTNPYWTISNLTLNDAGYSMTGTGMWQKMYCRGLFSVVNSEIGYLTFEHVNVSTKWGNTGVIGTLTGRGHHLALNDVRISDTRKNTTSYTGFVSYLKDCMDHIYMNDCHISSQGSYTAALAAYLHPYTHNNGMNNIYVENSTAVADCDNKDREVGQGLLIGCSYRTWGIRCNTKAAGSAANAFSSITVTGCTSASDGHSTGLIMGIGGGYMKDCTVSDSTVTSTSYITGAVVGKGHWYHGENITVDHVTVDSSGHAGGIAGRDYYYDGVASEHSCYFKNCTVKDSVIIGKGYQNNSGYIWRVGGLCGYFESSSHNYGCMFCMVDNCRITGISNDVGGLIGYSYYACRYEGNTVKNTHVEGAAEVGGIHGGSRTDITTLFFKNTVDNCEVVGTRYVGGMIGYGPRPYYGNIVRDTTVVGTEYDVGGAVGILGHNKHSDISKQYSRQDNGAYSVLVKNCSVYGRTYVGGGAGSVYWTLLGHVIVEDCDIRGYYGVGGIAGRTAYRGTDNASDEVYYYVQDSYVTNSTITEMDDISNENLRTKFDVSIEPTSTRRYFGGVTGYAGSLWYCMADNCVISAPNSDFVGGLMGLYYITWRSGYSENNYSVCKDCVVIGKDYVAGMYGGLRAGFNRYHVIQTERISANYSYSNALVSGENHVAGICGMYAADNEPDARTFNPVLTGLYFTGSIQATGTEEGSGIAAGIFANQSINTRLIYEVTKYDEEGKAYKVKEEADDYFRLDGIVSMPSSITGKTVYPLINNQVENGFGLMTVGAQDCFLTLWKKTKIVENGTEKSIAAILGDVPYKDYVFTVSDYGSVIGTDGKRTSDPRFILLLDEDAAPSVIYEKAFRSATNKGYSCGVAFKNIKAEDASMLMPLCKKTDNSVYPFGRYTLTADGKTYTNIYQGVPLPGTGLAETVAEKQAAIYDSYTRTGKWSGGEKDVEKLIREYVNVYASDVDKVNVEFKTGFYTADLGNSVHIDSAVYTVTKGDEGSYSKVKTQELTEPKTVAEASAETLTYNFMDSLTVNVSYVLSDTRTGIIGVNIPAVKIRKPLTDAYQILDGSVYTLAEVPVSVLDKSTAAGYEFPGKDKYDLRAYITSAGKAYLDTGVVVPESEVFLDFCIDTQKSNTFILGRDTTEHDMLIGFNGSGNGFGYFGSLLSNNFGYATALKKGTRYMLHTTGLTNALSLEMLNKSAGETVYKSYYSSMAYDAYLNQIPVDGDKSQYTIYLGGAYWQGFYGKIYGIRMYSNGRLVRDMVPVTQKSDTKAGLYDLVTDTFYSNKGSVAFGAPTDGSVVSRGEQEYVHIFKNGGVTRVMDARGNITEIN